MTTDTIEIYVRNSGGRNLLIAHAGDEARQASEKAAAEGRPTAFVELTVLPEWITVEERRNAHANSGDLVHVRIPIAGDLRS